MLQMSNLLTIHGNILGTSINIALLIIWIVIVLGCIITEILSDNFITIWFSLGGFIAIILLACGQEWYIQVPVFVGSSCLTLACFYPWLRKYVVKFKALKTNAAGLIDQTARVLSINYENPGVKDGIALLNDSRWTFIKINPDEIINPNDLVVIKKISGSRIYVVKYIK